MIFRAKFHKDSPSDKKVKLNLPSAIELSETAVLCTTLHRNPMQVSNFGGAFDQLFSFAFFYETFTEDAALLFLYHGAKKSKMTKTSNQGGPTVHACMPGVLALPELFFRPLASEEKRRIYQVQPECYLHFV